MTLAVQAVACANVDICFSGDDISGCTRPVSKSTVAVFAARSAEDSSVYERFTGGATDSDKVGACLLFNDNGVNINSLSALPYASFTLEIQVDPISYGDVILSYHSAATFLAVNRESGLERSTTAVTTQPALGPSVLHVYVVVSYTNTLVHVVRLPSDAFTRVVHPGGEIALQAMRGSRATVTWTSYACGRARDRTTRRLCRRTTVSP